MYLSRFRLRFGSPRRIAFLVLSLCLASFPARSAAAEGITWNSYAEIGLGATFIGAGAEPLMAVDTGIILGAFELGARTVAVPLEFGSPDLIQVAAARFAGTLGYRPDMDWFAIPFARIGLGHVGLGRVPEGGKGDMTDLKKEFDCSLTLGLELPIGGRWSALAWGSWDYAPGAEDYEGESLSGPSVGLSLRATWETRLR
jgi:hypothetical protein